METSDVDLIQKWFDAAGHADGPLMPDGWFGGRPRENQYFLKGVESNDDMLTLQLSEDTTMQFDGLGQVVVEKNDLVFIGFRKAILRWKHYGGGHDAPMYERTYCDGKVVLAAPIGVNVDVR